MAMNHTSIVNTGKSSKLQQIQINTDSQWEEPKGYAEIYNERFSRQGRMTVKEGGPLEYLDQFTDVNFNLSMFSKGNLTYVYKYMGGSIKHDKNLRICLDSAPSKVNTVAIAAALTVSDKIMDVFQGRDLFEIIETIHNGFAHGPQVTKLANNYTTDQGSKNISRNTKVQKAYQTSQYGDKLFKFDTNEFIAYYDVTRKWLTKLHSSIDILEKIGSTGFALANVENLNYMATRAATNAMTMKSSANAANWNGIFRPLINAIPNVHAIANCKSYLSAPSLAYLAVSLKDVHSEQKGLRKGRRTTMVEPLFTETPYPQTAKFIRLGVNEDDPQKSSDYLDLAMKYAFGESLPIEKIPAMTTFNELIMICLYLKHSVWHAKVDLVLEYDGHTEKFDTITPIEWFCLGYLSQDVTKPSTWMNFGFENNASEAFHARHGWFRDAPNYSELRKLYDYHPINYPIIPPPALDKVANDEENKKSVIITGTTTNDLNMTFSELAKARSREFSTFEQKTEFIKDVYNEFLAGNPHIIADIDVDQENKQAVAMMQNKTKELVKLFEAGAVFTLPSVLMPVTVVSKRVVQKKFKYVDKKKPFVTLMSELKAAKTKGPQAGSSGSGQQSGPQTGPADEEEDTTMADDVSIVSTGKRPVDDDDSDNDSVSSKRSNVVNTDLVDISRRMKTLNAAHKPYVKAIKSGIVKDMILEYNKIKDIIPHEQVNQQKAIRAQYLREYAEKDDQEMFEILLYELISRGPNSYFGRVYYNENEFEAGVVPIEMA